MLTLSPIHLPDPGIENFVKLALEHNPSIRVTVQENWLPFDIYDTTFKIRSKKVDHNCFRHLNWDETSFGTWSTSYSLLDGFSHLPSEIVNYAASFA